MTTEPKTHLLEERHDPSNRTDYLSRQHIERYLFAGKLLKPGSTVLDIACGVGYGSSHLSSLGTHVIGADYDAATIAIAKEAYPNVIFRQADALQLPFDECAFDNVVSFETIEHVRDGRSFLDEMKRVLRPGGLAVLSTPNIKFTSHPEYHVREYAPLEFFDLVEDVFPGSKRYAQYFMPQDRAKDILKRWAPSPLKSVLRPLIALQAAPSGRPSANLSASASSEYSVLPYDPKKRLLRIMVAVCRREN